MQRQQLGEKCLERFLRYVQVDTQAIPGSESYPSSPGQMVLLKSLAEELKELGLTEVSLDPYGYVMATIPATLDADVPVVGFIAHVDTSPETSGKDVKPIVHRNYEGGDIVLPDDPSVIISPKDSPALKDKVGEDIVTASGTTLLGADDKAGVAEIITAAQFLLAHPEIPHGKIRVAFTPDEEIGLGTKYFDIKKFGASFAYTLDGGEAGSYDIETFSGDAVQVRVRGNNTHPGDAKNKMVNAVKVAARFLDLLPKDELSPETTAEREPYMHPMEISGGVGEVKIRFILRSFETPDLAKFALQLDELAKQAMADYPGSQIELIVQEQYRNMRDTFDAHPRGVELGRKAIEAVGLECKTRAIRGGTDGTHLSHMGLPTPNLFAGEYNFHARHEWVSVQDMAKAAEVVVELAKLWASA